MSEGNSAAGSHASASMGNPQTYFSILKEIQEHIRFSDRKAAFYVAFNAFLFGFGVRVFDQLMEAYERQIREQFTWWTCMVLLATYAVVTVTAVGLVAASFVATFGNNSQRSKVYFGHIAAAYNRSADEYVRDTRNMTDADWMDEIGRHIVDASVVAASKEKLLRLAAWVTLGAFLLWAMAFSAYGLVPGTTPVRGLY